MKLTLLHPSLKTLKGFADAELAERRRPRIAAHLADCDRCRRQVAGLRTMRDRLRGLRVPEPSEELFARIEASRAEGRRVILPGAEPQSPPNRRALTLVGAGLAAAAAVVLLWPRSGTDGQPMFELFDGTPLMPAILQAQQISDTAARARFPLLGAVDGSRVRIGGWTYAGRMITDGIDTSAQGVRMFSVVRGERNGHEVWIVTTSTTGRYTRGAMGDSLFLEQGSLRLTRRVMYYTGGHARARDYPDSLQQPLSWRQADVGWHGTLHKLLFQLTPLSRSWHGSAYVALPVDRDRWRIFPLDQQVVGEERVRVPAGTFDCWKVDTKLRRTEATLWIAKSGQWVVKLAQHMGSDAVWEQVLTAYTVTPPAP
ncbi:MAG: hypothetical protein DMD29_01400 [Gemmatimonadetes bacterium]|nr:MAG: hypothetical protein DMD29_01400 [Gemmatimonadota bacterium]